MTRRWLLLLAAMPAVVLCACGRAPPAPPGAAPAARPAAAPATPEARAAALDAATTLARTDGHWDHGRERVDFSGYFEGRSLRYLVATTSRPGAPPLTNRYYFENGALFYVRGEAPEAGPGAGPAATLPVVPLRAAFRGAEVLSAVRVEHFGEVRLDAAAILAIRRDAAALASAVTAEHNAAEATRAAGVSAAPGSPR